MDEAPHILGRGPRPLAFIRVRLYRDGPAEYLRELLEDEQEALFEELGNLRRKGVDESSEEVQDVRRRLHYLINIMRDVNSGFVELVGGAQ